MTTNTRNADVSLEDIAIGAHHTRAVDAAVPPVPEDERFLRVRDVADRIGLSVPQVWALVSEEAFPRPWALGPRYTRWLASDVRRWMADRLMRADPSRRALDGCAHSAAPAARPSSQDRWALAAAPKTKTARKRVSPRQRA